MFIDSHVNLHGDRYEEDLEGVLDRAREADVRGMLVISDHLAATPALKTIVAPRPWLWRSIGVHPHHAKDYADLTAERLISLATETDVIGIGECGLDFHYEYSDRDRQQAVFHAHIVAAQETGLPLIIHSREADDEMAATLEAAYAERPFPILLHCYTGGEDLARRALAMGGYVAFSGIVTFKKADEVREVAKMIPMDRLLIETDCPFLAPVPHRGRRNEPAYLPLVAAKLAEVKGIEPEILGEATTDNFFRLFSKAQRPS
ncbi:urease/pyrimidinase family protein [Parvularcula bermudensis HTCC2503]|uniref:Urease/pyrimidinase family protein n=1 Tax=Parvularcula bermudensis (strain ATCC BAA-594 / HTCC2503 / KCTC 12087) TaxID=314260 RepID=E0TIF0_PARBH|nr:TatD family hydrolase [Parvularcula bermudensis]ADM10269.1 urease/pyrimidinase family protein [Parvularcula bermudensis HTCC2503]